jgi:allophanate hydrolase
MTMSTPSSEARGIGVAVVGAHLSGQPLNHQLTSRGGRLVRSGRTAAAYRLYALAGTVPPKPGLVHVGGGGSSIEIEIWELDADAFGTFVELVPAPLAIGSRSRTSGQTPPSTTCDSRCRMRSPRRSAAYPT